MYTWRGVINKRTQDQGGYFCWLAFLLCLSSSSSLLLLFYFMHLSRVQFPRRPAEGGRTSRAGVRSSSELPDVGAGNGTGVLWKSREHT